MGSSGVVVAATAALGVASGLPFRSLGLPLRSPLPPLLFDETVTRACQQARGRGTGARSSVHSAPMRLAATWSFGTVPGGPSLVWRTSRCSPGRSRWAIRRL